MLSTRDKNMQETAVCTWLSTPSSGHPPLEATDHRGLPEDAGCLQILSQQGMSQAKSCTYLDNYVFQIYADRMVINVTFI